MSRASDEEIGHNLRILRGTISQAELASRMTDLNFAWSQNTVYQVETGKRPLRITEAVALAEILGFRINALLTPPAKDKVKKELEEQTLDLKADWQAFSESATNLIFTAENFLENIPYSFSDEEKEELYQAKLANIEEIAKFNFWEGLTKAVYDYYEIKHHQEQEPLEVISPEDTIEYICGLKKSDTYSAQDSLFHVNRREYLENIQTLLTDFYQDPATLADMADLDESEYYQQTGLEEGED